MPAQYVVLELEVSRRLFQELRVPARVTRFAASELRDGQELAPRATVENTAT